jgi:phosphoglycolate phosphatase
MLHEAQVIMRLMKHDLVIFDLDGTLIDSRLDLASAVNRMLEDLGRPLLPVEQIVTFVGNGVVRLLERAVGDPSLVEGARPIFERHYGESLLVHTRAYPGVDRLVRALGADRRLAVATNKPGPWARSIVAGLGWSETIPHVVGGGDVARLKPAPDMVEWLIEKSGCSRAKAVVVGDMDVDVKLARAAGLSFIGVSWGLAGRARLQAAGAQRIVDSAAELEALFR